MSFLKSLFGRGRAASDPPEPVVAREIEHKGFMIRATPFQEAGQYQTAGVVAKEIAGVVREHKFIRADRFSVLNDAVECALGKGRQIIDEQGEGLFGSGR